MQHAPLSELIFNVDKEGVGYNPRNNNDGNKFTFIRIINVEA